jgi:hypothetical protein
LFELFVLLRQDVGLRQEGEERRKVFHDRMDQTASFVEAAANQDRVIEECQCHVFDPGSKVHT